MISCFGHQNRQHNGSREQNAFNEPVTDEQKPSVPSNNYPESSRHSSRRRKHSSTASSSFDRVAAWVKDVSVDLSQSQEQSTASHKGSRAESRSSSCHQSCCERRHHSHRKRRHRRHHRNHCESSCSKCAQDICALCEAEDRSCSRTCQKCSYSEEERRSGGRHVSEPSHNGSSCSLGSKKEVSFKSHHSSSQVVQ